MKEKKSCMTRLYGGIDIFIERKSVKKIRLKVFPDGVVKLSAPLGVSGEWINDYLNGKTKWIENSLNYFKDVRANELDTIHSGISTRILGRQKRIIVKEGKIYKIEQKEDYVYIQSPAIDDKQALQKQFERW